ncbi:MAG: hypothetical protein QOC81_2176 [Thermoanaerobaculia bacterium]|jgi:uncharacterized repeat protein (TIGR01451 family)|nr:hypothetical protein [Thermoanaerobaculia bacterium]
MKDFNRSNLRTILTSTGVSVAAIVAILLLGLAGSGSALTGPPCTGTAYSVVTSSAPPTSNWTNTSLWNPPVGSYPGRDTPCDSASDTNSSVTVITVDSAIPNPIASLNLSCTGGGCTGGTVDITSGGSLTITGPSTIGTGTTVKLSGGTLTIASGGSLTFQPGSQFLMTAGIVDVKAGGQLTLDGTYTVGGTAQLQVNGGTLTITPTSTLTVQNNLQLNLDGKIDGGGTIQNNGVFEVVGTDTATVDAVFNNNAGGTGLHVWSGTLALRGGGTGNSPFNIDGGTTLEFPQGIYTMNGGGSVSGEGRLSITGGTLNIGGVTSPGAFFMNSGTLDGDGFLSIRNTFTWSGGTIKSTSGNAGTELAGHGTGTLDGGFGTMILDHRNFNNYGYIHYTATSSPLELDNGANFSTFGTFELNDDAPIAGAAPSSFNVYPNGLLWKVNGPGGTTTIYPGSTNNANVYASTGTLEFAGDIASSSGGFFAFWPATLKFSAPSSIFNSSSAIGGDGTVKFSAGTSEIQGNYDVERFVVGGGPGLTEISGGTVDIETSAYTNDFQFTSGTLTVNGDFTMGGNGTWSGGTMNASDPNAYFLVDFGATLTIDAATGAPTDDFLIFANDGTVNYTANATSPSNYLTFANNALADNTGLFDIKTDAKIASTGGSIFDSRKTIAGLAGTRGHAAKPATPVASSVAAARAARLAQATLNAAKRGKPHVLEGCGCPISNEFDNSGTVKKSAGAGSTAFGPNFVNGSSGSPGLLQLLSGEINFLGNFEQNNSSSATTLGGGNIAAANTFELNEGVLEGSGTLSGDLDNYGAVKPGTASTTGVIKVAGNYLGGASGSGGTLAIKLGPSAGQFDQLNITGTASLDGTLDVSLIGGYEPANGATFPVISFASLSGDFTTKNLPSWASGHGTLATSSTSNAYILTATVTAQSADLDADTLSGPASVNAGQPLSYTINVGNNGPDPVSGTITVVDTLPAGVTGATGGGVNWTCGLPSGGTITCTAPGPLGVAQLPTLTFSMTAPANGGLITDSVTVSSGTNDPSPSNNSKSVNTNVIAQADLSIGKTGPAGLTSGQNITYTVSVTNNGPSASAGVVVTDVTPANLTFVSNSGACVGPYPCSLGTLNSGQTVTITSTYSTSPSFSGSVTNSASVSATTADPVGTNNSIGFSTNVGAQADLSITKNGPASTNPGQTVTYTIVVTNGGPSPATGTTVSDPTPVGVAFISNSSSNPGCNNTTFPCTLGTLNAGQSVTITSTYSVPPSYSGGAIVNTASVTSSTNDPSNANNSATATTNVGASADVAITKSGPATASLGSNISYTITVSNFGPSGATAVTVSDPTPPGLTPVSVSGGGCTSFPCNIGALAVGPPVTITATYSIPANYGGASITNTATVSSASDSNATNNTSSTTATIAAQADLSVTKSGPPSATVSQTVTYTITVTNNGTLAAANTFVNDPTPPGLNFVSNSGACSGPYPCALGTVTNGSPKVITTTYSVPANYAATSITNTATVSTSSPDSNPADNSATVITPIAAGAPADLVISKSGPVGASLDELVDFVVTVINNGPGTANTVVVSDPTPSGLQFVSNSGGCTTAYPCNLGSVAPSTTVTITSRYRVTTQFGTITNTASVGSSSADPTPINNTASASMAITQVCPKAPTLLTPAAGAQVTSPVAFSWNGVAGATSYVVTITGTATMTLTTSATSLTQVLGNGSYSWTVKAVGAASCPPATSAASSFSVCNLPDAPLASVVALSTTGQTITVSWTGSEGANYELQESLDAAFSNPSSTTLGETSQSFTKNVQEPTVFYYRVRARAACSQVPTAFSPVASVIVIPLPGPNSINPNIPVPDGSKQPVTFTLHVAGVPGITTTFLATVDKPWLAVAPTSGLMPPEGINFTISADPSTLQNGTWTGTIIIILGTAGVSGRVHTLDTTKTSIPVSISLTSPVTPGTLTTPASTALVIPSVGHLAGLGAQWQSDIRIANITALSKKAQLTFSGGSATSSAIKQTTITIDPGATMALDDIVRNWYGVGAMGDSSNGILTVQPLDAGGKPDTSVSKAAVVSSRTYNASALGTLGQFIPAVPLANFISKAPGANSILALQQIAQTDTFRTNLGLVEATGKPASVLVSVFDGAGSRLLDLPLTIAGGEQRQLNSFLSDKGISLTNGHIEVQSTGGDGKVTAYASVIDSRTTDPLLVSGVPIGGTGASRFVIPGVASLDAADTWRSDVRIFNGSQLPQTTTLTFFPAGNPSASIVRETSIQPGEVKALDDIVHSTFNMTNASGALHVTTAVNAPLVVTARTFDQTSTGTLGQFVQAVTPADAVGASDRALQLLQMEDSPRYRTNLGIAEVTGKAVTAEITVILPDSKVAPKVQIPLTAFEFRQFPVLSSLGLGNTYNARISVKVIDGQGKITAYGSVIDQKTQDPTFVPAQ